MKLKILITIAAGLTLVIMGTSVEYFITGSTTLIGNSLFQGDIASRFEPVIFAIAFLWALKGLLVILRSVIVIRQPNQIPKYGVNDQWERENL